MWSTFSKHLVEAAVGLRELMFPRKCVVCGDYLDSGVEDICSECLDELPMTYQWDVVQNAAFERLARRFDVEAAAALFYFRSESDYRRILYAIKYGGRRRLGYRMGRLLGEHLKENREFLRCQAVVPVPLHPLRRWKRGYNQAEDIARGVAGAMGLPLETSLLRRSRRTRTQTRLSVEAKARNVSGAFAVDTSRANELLDSGCDRILLVDDTLTTGSTLAACAVTLEAAGFKAAAATLAFVS